MHLCRAGGVALLLLSVELHEPEREGAGETIADAPPIDHGDWRETPAGSSEEGLVGAVDVGEGEVALEDRDRLLVAEPDHVATRDPVHHAIGHGVGSYLHVHEGPQRFNTTTDVPLELGMVSSCEPGVDFEGAFGVRLENTIATVPSSISAFGTFYAFETPTVCPFDRDLIDGDMLTAEERTWLDTYHRTVRDALEERLGPDEARWLEERTRPLPPRTDAGSAVPKT
jgi:hypothetical protein